MITRTLAYQRLSRLLAPPYRVDYARDAILASYPRSGNTWIRAILFHDQIGRAPSSIKQIDLGIPDEHFNIPRRLLLGDPLKRRIVKSHAPCRLQNDYCRVACITRDPRDIALSYYLYLSRNQRLPELSLKDFTLAFVMGAVWPGSWYDHLNSWLNYSTRRPDRIWFISYEQLIRRDSVSITNLGQALQVSKPMEFRELFEKYDFRTMAALEAAGTRPNERHFIGDSADASDQFRIVADIIDRHAPHWKDLEDHIHRNFFCMTPH
jgi:hypothetical protein